MTLVDTQTATLVPNASTHDFRRTVDVVNDGTPEQGAMTWVPKTPVVFERYENRAPSRPPDSCHEDRAPARGDHSAAKHLRYPSS